MLRRKKSTMCHRCQGFCFLPVTVWAILIFRWKSFLHDPVQQRKPTGDWKTPHALFLLSYIFSLSCGSNLEAPATTTFSPQRWVPLRCSVKMKFVSKKTWLMLSKVILVVTGAFCRDYLWVLRSEVLAENNRSHKPTLDSCKRWRFSRQHNGFFS